MMGGIIAAISTPPGKGGVAIIRMCGEGCINIASKVFFPMSKKAIYNYPERTQIYGYIKDGCEVLDDCMLTFFLAPRSYTGEETVEIACHGGVLVTATILELLFKQGAAPAEAGEFTKRAFINGKLTLTDAEAIGRLLEAKSREQMRLAGNGQRALMSLECSKIRESLADILSSVFARIDYPEEDLGEYTDEQTVDALSSVKISLEELISTYRTGRAISEGIETVIVGKPNVGKSTLYNLILGYDAAIVTDIAGTTRDVLSESVSLGKVTLRLYDTAGIRKNANADEVERIGIMRSLAKLSTAELIFALFDTSTAPDDEDDKIFQGLKETEGTKIAIFTKSDLSENLEEEYKKALKDCGVEAYVAISAKQDGKGAIYSLERAVSSLFISDKISVTDTAIVATARQHSSLSAALMHVDAAISAYKDGVPADAAASEIELALCAIGELDGRAVSELVTNSIFSRFCVGK